LATVSSSASPAGSMASALDTASIVGGIGGMGGIGGIGGGGVGGRGARRGGIAAKPSHARRDALVVYDDEPSSVIAYALSVGTAIM
jgi:hypothetical protein